MTSIHIKNYITFSFQGFRHNVSAQIRESSASPPLGTRRSGSHGNGKLLVIRCEILIFNSICLFDWLLVIDFQCPWFVFMYLFSYRS